MNEKEHQNIQVCPECGRSNACQNTAKSGAVFSCWCQEVTLSENACIELKRRGLSEGCLCQACLKLLNNNCNQDDA